MADDDLKDIRTPWLSGLIDPADLEDEGKLTA